MVHDFNFMDKITNKIEKHKVASFLLGVRENANSKELKKAYRKAALKYHPDHNRGTSDANRKFVLIKCAYDFLAHGLPCSKLIDEMGLSYRNFCLGYKLDNSWGHFLWWRKRFFGQEEHIEQEEHRGKRNKRNSWGKNSSQLGNTNKIICSSPL